MTRLCSSIIALTFSALAAISVPAQTRITPEQIYQPNINWDSVIGAWEALSEKGFWNESKSGLPRSLMTLRIDGTCRVFNEIYPSGSDGLWSYEGHKLFVKFPDGYVYELLVYGVKGDFMVTGPIVGRGEDRLWMRVK